MDQDMAETDMGRRISCGVRFQRDIDSPKLNGECYGCWELINELSDQRQTPETDALADSS